MKTATYTTNGFIVGSTIAIIFIISQLSLWTMVPFLFLGLHPLIIMVIFMLAIYFGLKAVTGKIEYTIDGDGLTRDITPFLFKKFWKSKAFQFYSWEQIKDFKTGTDMGRSYEEFEYITINTFNGKKIEINTKKGDQKSFKEFENVFRSYVADASKGTLIDGGKPITQRMLAEEKDEGIQIDAPTIQHEIKEKSSFYDRPIAKILTVFFGIFTLGLMVIVLALGAGSFSSIFRILFVMIPGVIYMYWRSFVQKKK